ncbi:MAG: hypothetical protein HXY50_16165 [Ignavibacteriaceae bacterium]|nr:hypothetical protein [Ignavibacteriaceae bacterium]
MKKLVLSRLVIAFIIITTSLIAQQNNENVIDMKGLSQDDIIRIFGDIYNNRILSKHNGEQNKEKNVIISGNKITTILYNTGSICRPNIFSPPGNIADLVWQGLGYGYEFGPLVTGQVAIPNNSGGFDSVITVDDSFIGTTQGGYSPDGTQKWGWLPKSGYADPDQDEIARLNAPDKNGDGKPDSWPDRWYSPEAGKYVWPAFLGDQATAPDEEVYYVLDDYTNKTKYVSFGNPSAEYYPFPSDSTKRGLGLDAEVRVLQFNNALAEDIMFLVYRITNASEKSLPRLYMGMHGDPHVGGYTDYSDDKAFFIPPTGTLADPYAQRARSMVYAWDEDMSGMSGLPAGYFGWKFLESPSQNTDGLDNDDDGIIDDSPFNSKGFYIDGVNNPLTFGIADLDKYRAVYGEPKKRWSGDEDGDWDILKNDIGIDGIPKESPNYPGADYGEGDGFPSQGWYLDANNNDKYDAGEIISDERFPGYKWAGSEPNFGLRDITESDQLGLTSFHAATYTSSLPNVPKNTTLMWEWLSSETIDPNQELLQSAGDNIFNFGTGPLSLQPGETQRFSMAILFGQNLDDLLLNAETSFRVLESDYLFAKPPEKPKVVAVPGDGKVTLYWDTKSEQSFDPFTRVFDFQGYKIYRSQDYTFSDIYTITDANGVPFIGQALRDKNGKLAQFDLIDSLSGFHPTEYLGRGIKYNLGTNTGLVHEYVDETVKNGIKYFYAIVGYDGGSIEFSIPPTECQAVIQKDPITSELSFDQNTVEVTPGPLPLGIKNAEAGIAGKPTKISGNSTGEITVKVLNDLAVEQKLFKLEFTSANSYRLLDSTGISDKIISKDTVYVALSHENIQEGSFELYDQGNNVVSPSKYTVNYSAGKIKGNLTGDLPSSQPFTAKYRYFPIPASDLLNGEDGNPSFNGLRLYVTNDSLSIDYKNSGFINSSTNLNDTIFYPPTAGNPKVKYRADWELRWTGFDTTATGQWVTPGDTAQTNLGSVKVVCPFKLVNTTTNETGKFILFVTTGTQNFSRWKVSQPVIIRPQNATGSTTSYEVRFSLPTDSLAIPIYPKAGDVYAVKTSKPFQAGDTYVFNSTDIKFESSDASASLGNIYVVPNPYVAYSSSEQPGRSSTLRGDRDLQFMNLPPKCTIRIYTLMGELVQTIEKDDLTSSAHWDLLSNEGQRIAYGIYIYHVDAPNVGEYIGRIAVIK